MSSAMMSEAGRLMICFLFLAAVVGLCKVWPSKAARREREYQQMMRGENK